MHNLLAIDIGNTSITSGLFTNSKLIKKWRIKTDKNKSVKSYISAYKSILENKKITDVVISSVVPQLDKIFVKVSQALCQKNPVFLNYKNCPIKIKYKKRWQIGADRLANTIAGLKISGSPLIIIDFGTAITFDCVNKKGEYIGGIILPGIEISSYALHSYTAKLPLVKFSRPKNIIGTTTQEGIKSGFYFGYIGMLKYLIENLKKKLKCDKIIATGGYSNLFTKKLKIKAYPDLTLIGLKLFFENLNGGGEQK
ncbi:MAG: type III pantothenate kinase [Endomicrobiia bacterium]